MMPKNKSPSPANIQGGSQNDTADIRSMPGPTVSFMATDFPARTSSSVGTNQGEISGQTWPRRKGLAFTCGLPGTSTSLWIERWPEDTLVALMLDPLDLIY
jgi:hypothetical protein